jgi:beta-N-acetylhexosaminidase
LFGAFPASFCVIRVMPNCGIGHTIEHRRDCRVVLRRAAYAAISRLRAEQLDAGVPPVERHLDAGAPLQLPEDLHDRIGQMVLVGFRGLTPPEAEPTLRQIREGSIGGVVIYDVDAETGGPRNVSSPRQLSELVTAIKAAGPIPPLVTLDAEGGSFHKLRPHYGFAPTASARDIGERNDPTFTRFNAGVIAEMLAEAGIDMNLAPVVDLLNPANGRASRARRTIAPDPALVIAHAREFILTHRERGILTTLKHFPGMMGNLKPYSRGLNELIEDWSEVELEPFRVLISEGLADAVLTTRALYPQLDPDFPACLSKKIVGGLLRSKLGYDGVIISDPMEMQAVWDAFGFEAGTVLAVNAGIDLVLLCNISSVVHYSDDRADEVIRILTDAVARGEIAESRIDQACSRVLALKARLPR